MNSGILEQMWMVGTQVEARPGQVPERPAAEHFLEHHAPQKGSCSAMDMRLRRLLCAGAKAAPMAAMPVLLAVRMGRYLSGPGRMPVQDLVPAYLKLLEELSSFAAGRRTPKCWALWLHCSSISSVTAAMLPV